ncbi:hypothetical protein [Curtobacterium sp. MCBD17_003]|uniref:hypothetical protein n=1 Tax=Curtobacterium sp. MCBD17_003 TaxID=2175667 RepID=UPI000DAA3084|nr:hypothetical protein [Curtobacterium sp. MCBD17_003]WIE55558.1 hypothetical protein DEI88_005000 [Curtobacterium sp. MCBD17_003]
MKRINITYGGIDYSVTDADLDEVKATLLAAVQAEAPTWMRVNHGEGSYRQTELLIEPGVSIAITGIDAD